MVCLSCLGALGLVMEIRCGPVDHASQDAGDSQDGDGECEVEHGCLSCSEVGVVDKVDGWKVLEVDALSLGPILVVRSDPLDGLPSLSEVPVRVMDGESEVPGVTPRRLD